MTTYADSLSGETLIVAARTDFKPFEYIDADGKLTGIDIDVIEALTDYLGAGINFVTFDDWVQKDEYVARMKTGEIDLFLSAIELTDERADVWSPCIFTNPYMYHYYSDTMAAYSILAANQELADAFNAGIRELTDNGSIASIISGCDLRVQDVVFPDDGTSYNITENFGYDKHGNVTDYEIQVYHADGSLAEIIDSYYEMQIAHVAKYGEPGYWDYWFDENGQLSYFVVNDLDSSGNIEAAYFCNPDGTLIEQHGGDIVLEHADMTVDVGSSFQLDATGGSGNYVWESQDTDVAVVQNGVVTAVGMGRTSIIVSDGNSSATCIIRVIEQTMLTPYVHETRLLNERVK